MFRSRASAHYSNVFKWGRPDAASPWLRSFLTFLKVLARHIGAIHSRQQRRFRPISRTIHSPNFSTKKKLKKTLAISVTPGNYKSSPFFIPSSPTGPNNDKKNNGPASYAKLRSQSSREQYSFSFSRTLPRSSFHLASRFYLHRASSPPLILPPARFGCVDETLRNCCAWRIIIWRFKW